MIVNNFGIQLIQEEESKKMFDLSGQKFLSDLEGVRYTSYKDTGGVWTIGRGIIRYEDGKKVQPGDTITQGKEQKLFMNTLQGYVDNVNKNVKTSLKQNQFNALVSFCYNVGIGAFNKSTLLKKVNINPNDKEISAQFMRWIYDNGKPILGLKNRRKKEANLYFLNTI